MFKNRQNQGGFLKSWLLIVLLTAFKVTILIASQMQIQQPTYETVTRPYFNIKIIPKTKVSNDKIWLGSQAKEIISLVLALDAVITCTAPWHWISDDKKLSLVEKENICYALLLCFCTSSTHCGFVAKFSFICYRYFSVWYGSPHVCILACFSFLLLYVISVVYCSFLPYYGEYRSIFLFLFYLLWNSYSRYNI